MTLERYFTSPLFADLQQNRRRIRDYVSSRHPGTTLAT